ncbi:hypothetical protein N0V88_006475 [Collariella sp. IMI 366227]|nr:hypothetical protein N0V88_006475 [Collariella sp. IMI 366227]
MFKTILDYFGCLALWDIKVDNALGLWRVLTAMKPKYLSVFFRNFRKMANKTLAWNALLENITTKALKEHQQGRV